MVWPMSKALVHRPGRTVQPIILLDAGATPFYNL